jgi:hypothetical protein
MAAAGHRLGGRLRRHGVARDAGLDPFAVRALAVTGAGAGDAVRAMVAGLLDAGHEVVITREDAEELLGVSGADRELVVADDLAAAKNHLAAPGAKRLLVTSGGLDLVDDVLRFGSTHAVSLAAWRYDTAEIGADGEVVALTGPDPYLGSVITGPVRLLSRDDVREWLAGR